MSRSITVTAKYMNNKIVSRGVRNPTNMGYITSLISFTALNDCFDNFKQKVKDKNIKDLKVVHNVSGGNSSIYFEATITGGKYLFDTVKHLAINEALFKPFK